MSTLAVITPIYEDVVSLRALLSDMDAALTPDTLQSLELSAVVVFIVDDGSTREPTTAESLPAVALPLTLVHLAKNVGHQRAIAVGLTLAARDPAVTHAVVLDGDGEDRPRDIPTLVRRLRRSDANIIHAERGRRVQTWQFALGTRLYRRLFYSMTTKALTSGNFTAIDRRALDLVVATPAVWTHYPAALMRLGLIRQGITVDRAARYAGESRVGYAGLVEHGLRSIAVFEDVAQPRVWRLVIIALVSLGLLALGPTWWLALGLGASTLTALGVAALTQHAFRVARALPRIYDADALVADTTPIPPSGENS